MRAQDTRGGSSIASQRDPPDLGPAPDSGWPTLRSQRIPKLHIIVEGTTSFWGASFDRGAGILEDIIGKGRTQLGTWSGVGEKSRGTSHGEGNNCLGTSSGEGEQPSGDLIWGGEAINWRHHTGRGNAWGPLDLSGLHLIARLCAHMSLPDSAKLSVNW